MYYRFLIKHGMTLVGNVMLNPDFIGTGSFQDLMNKWIPWRARNDIGGNGFRVRHGMTFDGK